jgi:glycerol-3-phosphate acyltransferase PlsY
MHDLVLSLPAAGPALVLLGYLCGSFLASYYLPLWLCHTDVTRRAEDHNPGAANAFCTAGVPMGILCLACDIFKGALPVSLAVKVLGIDSPWLALILAAPVIGHAFPFYRHGRGGKGIAVSFGVLIGLWPVWMPLWSLVFFYLLFTLILVVSPHAARSILTFGLWAGAMALWAPLRSVRVAALVIGSAVIYRHAHTSAREQTQVKLFKRA